MCSFLPDFLDRLRGRGVVLWRPLAQRLQQHAVVRRVHHVHLGRLLRPFFGLVVRRLVDRGRVERSDDGLVPILAGRLDTPGA